MNQSSVNQSSVNMSTLSMDTHEPLFPVPVGSANEGISYHDWLAAIALPALTTRGLEVKADRAYTDDERDLALATHYRLADAMLLARTASAKERPVRRGTTSREAAPARQPTRT